jgi:hypothetical protein
MPKYESGVADNCVYKKVAAGQTTAAISVPSDGIRGVDYLERVIITAASTAAPGVVTVFDGTTSLLAHQFVAGTMTALTEVVEIGVLCDSTKGFNITTGTSVSVVAVGRF